jgi:hypothetical protein
LPAGSSGWSILNEPPLRKVPGYLGVADGRQGRASDRIALQPATPTGAIVHGVDPAAAPASAETVNANPIIGVPEDTVAVRRVTVNAVAPDILAS